MHLDLKSLATVLLGLVLAGCASVARDSDLIAQNQRYGDPAGQQEEAAPSSTMWSEQKVIRNGTMELGVANVDNADQQLREIAGKHEGLITNIDAENGSTGYRRTISVRVPSQNFDALLDEVSQLGTIERQQVTTQDITKAYAGLETRLEVKQQAAERIRAIMANRTGNLSEVLAAEKELERLTSEIEVMLGEQRYYDHLIATSTLQVTLAQGKGVIKGAFQPIRNALLNSIEVVGMSIGAIISVTAFAIPWTVVGFLAFLIGTRIRRKRRKSDSGSTSA